MSFDAYTVNPRSRILAVFVHPGTTAFYWTMGTSNSPNDVTNIYSYTFNINVVYEFRIDVNPTEAKFYA